MVKRPSPRIKLLSSRSFPFTVGLLLAMAGLASCGGGSSSTRISTGGGGGGGGGNGANCVVSTQPSIPSSIVGNGVGNTVPSNYMDLHVGSADLISTVTVPYGGLRLWDTSTGWAQVNFASGQYDWSNLDSFVNTPVSGDILYNLARTPTWASSKPSDNSCGYDTTPQGGPGQCDPPADLNSDGTGTDQDWINWVSAVASRYAGKIKYYEIWNEWNIQLFWTGTPAQLVRMEQDASCVIEGTKHGSCTANGSVFPMPLGIDPSAQIVTPSPVGAHTDLNQVSKELSSYFGTTVGGIAGGTFADVIGFHGYVSTPSSSDPCPSPEEVTSVVSDLNGVLPGSEASKPWFDTEASWGKAPDEGFEDPDRQAAFLARDFLLQWSLGVDRVYWYRWDATNTYGGALWTSSSGPTEAASAWTEVSKWMVGNTLTTACTPVGTVWSCGFGNGSWKGLAVWDASQDCLNGSCSTRNYTVPTGYSEYLDLTGTSTSTSAGSTIQIGAKPILLENGTLP
jgi:polysaccharide biosynthesis protein PslG